jgi:hypothetical protein
MEVRRALHGAPAGVGGERKRSEPAPHGVRKVCAARCEGEHAERRGVDPRLALILAVLVLVGLRSLLLGPVFWIGVVSSVILSLSAMGAMGRFREPAGQEHHDLRLTIGLAVAALVSIPLVIWLADLAGLAGA